MQDNGIELYCGKNHLNGAEKQVLNHLIHYFASVKRHALIIGNMSISGKQIDLMVVSDKLTLQIEVKNFRKKHLIAPEDGDWFLSDDPSGPLQIVGNGYRQTLNNAEVIRDATVGLDQKDEKYFHPQGMLLFVPCVWPSFDFQGVVGKDRRVKIRSLDELDSVLAEPSWKPWEMEQARKFIASRNLKRCQTVDDMCVESDDANTTSFTRPAPVAKAVLEPAVAPTHMRPSKPKLPLNSIMIDVGPARTNSRRSLRRLGLIALLVCVTAGGLYHSWWRDGGLKPAAMASKPTTQAKDPAKTDSHHKKTADGQHIGQPSPADKNINRVPEHAVVNHKALAPITCPANVERLGCNGRVGTFTAPQCPAGFHTDGSSCAPDV